jgi:outer membrane autotransporter protein
LAPTLVNGDMTVMVASSNMVQGGTGNSVGVRFVDGVNNTLENHGGISTLNGISGVAISGTGGNETVNNYGVVFGSVDLGAGGNAFNNEAGAVLAAGSVINLGDNNVLANSGLLSLGGANGTRAAALTGNFVQTAGGDLQIKLGSTSAYDALNASGSAALDGTLSVFAFDSFLPVKGNTFTIVTASNGVTGQFASLEDPYRPNYALQLDALYFSNNVVLEVVQGSFLPFAHTPNQRSVARNLNSFSGLGTTGGDPRGANLIGYLDTIRGDTLPNDFDLIAPEELGALFDMNFAAVNMASQNIQHRMGDIRSGVGSSGSLSVFDPRGRTIQIASADHSLPVMNKPAASDDWGVFGAGNGQYVDVNGSTNAAGYHFDSAGVTIGVDKRVCDHAAVGFTLDYASTKASIADQGSVDVDGGRGGVYGTWFEGGHYLEAEMGGGYNHYNTTRPGLGGDAHGSTDGFEFDGMFGGGCDRKFGNFTLGPQAQAHYTLVEISQFTETGSMAPLQVQDNSSQSLLTQLGGHVAYDWKVNRRVLVQPQLALAWQHEFLDTDRAIDSRLASGAGNVFTVHSPVIGRDSLSLDAGVGVRWSRAVSTFVNINSDLLRQNYASYSISGGFNVNF